LYLRSWPIHLHHTLHPLLITTISTLNTIYITFYTTPLGKHHTLSPLLYNATIVTIGPCRMCRMAWHPSWYIVSDPWLAIWDRWVHWMGLLCGIPRLICPFIYNNVNSSENSANMQTVFWATVYDNA
jgi:hypothetical protein